MVTAKACQKGGGTNSMDGNRPLSSTATQQDEDDQLVGRGSRKKGALLPDRSLIATVASPATGRNKRRTRETRGQTTTAAGRGGGGDGGAD